MTAGRTALRGAAYLGLAAVVGALAGLGWHAVVRLPVYTVHDDGGAATTERGLTQVFGGDAWFAGIGLVVGLALGVLGWRWFRTLGWPVVALVLAAGAVAALVCAQLGQRLGPGPLDARLRTARPGDVVPIELAVRARVTYAVWLLGAVVPVLLRSALGHDPDDGPAS